MGTICSRIDEIYEDTRDRLTPQIKALEKEGKFEEAKKLQAQIDEVNPFKFTGRLNLPCSR